MRGKSIVEVVLIFGLFVFLIDLYKFTGLFKLELNALGWSYIGALQIVIPIIVIVLAKRNFASYGLTLRRWGYNLNVGLTCFLVLLIPYGAMILLLPMLGVSYLEPAGALLLSGFYALSIMLILTILRRRERRETYELLRASQSQPTSLPKSNPDRSTTSLLTETPATLVKEKSKTIQNVILLGFLLVLPILVGIYIQGPANFNAKIVSTVIYQFFISGFGEEIMFRGYVQSRINQEFGRPYKFLGVNFGVGLFVASFMFGFLHILNTFSPFTGSFTVLPWWGVSAFFSGLFFGFIREKTGSIVASGIAHGLPDAVGEAFGMIFSFV